jgi:hypothetical protein
MAADFVAKIVKDPKNPPATLMLTGYLGASSEDKHTRLYFDPHLSSYVEIPNEAILHKQDAKSDDGLGATHVWIARDAQLTYGSAGQERPKGTFLDGPIMQDHMAGAAGPGVAFPVTHPPICVPLTLNQFQCPPPHTIGPPCLPLTIAGPQCPPRTISPPCLPNTIRPPCLPLTIGGPQCPPRTIGPPCPPLTIILQQCPPPTLPIHCPTRPIVCNINTAPPICFQPTLSFICQTVAPQCFPRTVADPGCVVSGAFACPSVGFCGDPGGPVETPQLAAAAAPQAFQIATITPLGHVCATHTPGCGGGGHPMAQFMPTNVAYCTWYMCPQG